MKRFRDRKEAGRLLAQKLAALPAIKGPSLWVVALPRGGVPVAAEIAREFHAPLDVLVVRKLGVPWQPELAFGAVASGNVCVLNQEIVNACLISEEAIQAAVTREHEEVTRQEKLYRGNRPPLNVEGCTVILVDDGIATGATMLAAVAALTQNKPARLIVAVPVASPQTCEILRTRVESVITMMEPQWLDAVGSWYRIFTQVSDEEVRALLEEPKVAATATA